MKSFAFGAAAALLAAYTVAEDPQEAASAEQPHRIWQVSQTSIEGSSRGTLLRQNRGLPPFWGRKGVTCH
jgi:hypothetical protein